MNTFSAFTNWWAQQTPSTQFFWAVGLAGLLLIAFQGLIGILIGDHESPDSSEGSAFEGYLSIKTLSAMLIGIGFGGAAIGQGGFSIGFAVGGGILIGVLISASFLILMKSLHRLRSDGTAMIWEAIGQRGKVYMRIPGQEAAPGEIQVAFAGRLMNLPAFTRGAELPTGTDVLVISVHGEHALIVERVSTEQLTLN